MMNYGMMGGDAGVWGLLFTIVVFVDLVLVGVWLWQHISKPLSPEGERFTFGDAEASLGQVSSVVKLSPRLALSSSWDSMYSMIISSVIAPEVAAK